MELPATEIQGSMVYFQFLGLHYLMYNMPMLFALPESTDPQRQIDAVKTAILNHPALCSVRSMTSAI